MEYFGLNYRLKGGKSQFWRITLFRGDDQLAEGEGLSGKGDVRFGSFAD